MKLLKTVCASIARYASAGRPGERLASRALVITIILLLLIPISIAANNPGHDSLYVEQTGNSSLTGNLNVSSQLQSNIFKMISRFFGDYIDIKANGTVTTPTVPAIQAGTNTMYIDSPGNIYINSKAGTSATIQIGDTATNGVTFNVSGSITQQGTAVCLSDGTNCVSGSNEGNVSSIIAGNGISVDQAVGDVTVSANAVTCGAGEYSYWSGSAWLCRSDDTGSGDITAVNIGSNTCTSGDCDLTTLDGSGSGLDADLLDGQNSSYYLDNTDYCSGGTCSGALDVNGIGTFRSPSATGNGLVLKDNVNNYRGTWDTMSTGGFSFKDYTSIGWKTGISQYEGNVGIGTTSPGEALEVAGNINASGTINSSSDLCISGGTCLSNVLSSNPTLANVLIAGNSAGSTSLDMNGQDILSANNVQINGQISHSSAATVTINDALQVNGPGASAFTGNVSFDSGTLFVDSTNNNVGIGAASPLAKLSIGSNGEAGAFSVQGVGSGNIATFRDNDGENIFRSSGTLANNDFLLTFGDYDDAYGYNYMMINDTVTVFKNGDVGIGTTSPAASLDISGTGLSASFGTSGGISNQSYITVGQRALFGYDGLTTSAVIQGKSGKSIRFNVNNGTFGSGTAMTIDTSGRLGIGKTNPSYPLDVVGDIQTDGTLRGTGVYLLEEGTYPNIAGVAYSDSAYMGSRIGYSRARGTSASPSVVLDTDYLGWFDYFAWNGTEFIRSAKWLVQSDGGIVNGNAPGKYTFSLADDTGTMKTAMTLKQEGVGIFTSNPREKLDVSGNAIISGTLNVGDDEPFLEIDGQGGRMGDISGIDYGTIINVNSTNNTITMPNGNVGIGTTDPGVKLDVVGRIRSTEGLEEDGKLMIGSAALNDPWIRLNYEDDFTSGTAIYDDVSLGTGGMRIGAFQSPIGDGVLIVDNSVSIGTTTTGEALEVDGNITLSGYTNYTETDGNVIEYSNGCYQKVNSTGVYMIC